MAMEQNRNTVLAIALSLIVLVGWQIFYVNPKVEAERQAAAVKRQQEIAAQTAQPGAAPTTQAEPGAPAVAPGAAPAVPGGVAREEAVAKTPRVAIDTPRLAGSINLKGARIDDLKLKGYRVTIEDDSPLVTLLSPSETKDGYFAEFGWLGDAASGAMPGPDAIWTAPADAKLTPETPVTLTWSNDKGVTFARTINVDRDYLFTISDKVETAAPVSIRPYGRVTRFELPPTQANYVLHEGMIGVFGEDGLQQYTYSGIKDDREFKPEQPSTGGWLGITDKYWATAIVPAGTWRASYAYADQGRESYQAAYVGEPVAVAPGQPMEVRQLLFAGAKEVQVVDGYEVAHGIRNFELLIDWGWFYFITKPMFWLLDWLFKIFGNFGVAILIGTVLIKAVLFPLANMSYKSMAKMKKLQPEMEAIKARAGDDKVKMQQEMMQLYKIEKINPAAGCWPVLVQIPIFFALYKVLFITIEMRHAPFFGWIQDLAAPDPTSIFNLFGLIPIDVPPFLLIGVWPLIMGVTMFLQMQMNPAPPDPTQAMIFKWMPIVFTFMLATFPAGLVIYWAWNNLLSIIQQGIIMKQQGVKIELWDNLASMFRRKPKPAE